jgi:hypothetical protein
MLACRRTGKKWPIHERLIRVITQVSDHFGGRTLRVVSGFRPWSQDQYTTESKHNIGQALDFSIPGVPNEAVRDFCRSFRDVGCGYYPNSSFVHLDVREQTAHWVDYSGPGEAPRYAQAGAKGPGAADRSSSLSGNPRESELSVGEDKRGNEPQLEPAPQSATSAAISSELTEIGRLLREQGLHRRDHAIVPLAPSSSGGADFADKKRATTHSVAPASSSRTDTHASSQPEAACPGATTRARSTSPRPSRPAGS